MSKEQILEDLSNAVINCKADLATNAAKAALDEGIDPVLAINEGLVKGMSVVGERYAEHKVYLPQVLVSARCLYNGLDVLLPAIPKEALADSKRAATVVVEGDVHDIGKNIVKTMLTAGGYMVTDLGKDVPSAEIAGKAKELGINVLCMSTLMTPTMDRMPEVISLLKENGCRSNCTVTIGGPPTSSSFAEEISADHRDNNAQDCINWLKAV